jgi:hypothetical protein
MTGISDAIWGFGKESAPLPDVTARERWKTMARARVGLQAVLCRAERTSFFLNERSRFTPVHGVKQKRVCPSPDTPATKPHEEISLRFSIAN